MGFINADIPLAVEPATEDLYKVILANERYAYIPKEMVSDTTVAPETMEVCPTQSVMVSNEGKYDRIRIGLPVRKPYIIRENSYPRQMVIELFGTQNNSNWMTQYTDLEAVENIEVIQGHSNITTYVINLKKATSWGYSADYEGNNLIIKIKHPFLFIEHQKNQNFSEKFHKKLLKILQNF